MRDCFSVFLYVHHTDFFSFERQIFLCVTVLAALELVLVDQAGLELTELPAGIKGGVPPLPSTSCRLKCFFTWFPVKQLNKQNSKFTMLFNLVGTYIW